jgi:hypothetical protein
MSEYSYSIDKDQLDIKYKPLVSINDHISQGSTLDIPKKVTECALDITGNVCSTKSTVKAMKKHLQEKKINTTQLKEDIDIVNTIKEDLKCDTEECVLKNHYFAKDNIRDIVKDSLDRIKPEGPSNSTKLLNNENIDNVLKKLTKRHKGFYHMNMQMIDFAGEKDISGEWIIKNGQKIKPTSLGKIDMVRDVLNKGFKTFGVVMNTDYRTGGGIHWFSLFVCLESNPITVEYFNSSGNKPVKQIQDWLIKTEENLKSAGNKVQVVILSGMVHQRDSETECGPYSIYYIWNRLNGIPPTNFQNKRVPDAKMIAFRKSLFKDDSS